MKVFTPYMLLSILRVERDRIKLLFHILILVMDALF